MKFIRLALLGIALPSQVAQAQQLSFQPRASLGYQHYRFEALDDVANLDFMIGGVGASIRDAHLFFDVYAQANLTESKDNGLTLEANERKEINFTFGYAFTTHFSGFGGVKYANTTFLDFEDDEIDIEYYGPFFGLAYTIPIEPWSGALSLSGSFVYLQGDLSLFDVSEEDEIALEGESIGVNAGVVWSGGFGPLLPALPGLGYALSLDASSYSFFPDIDDDEELFSEDILRVKTDISYRF